MRTERHRLIHALFKEYIDMYASRDDRLTTHFSENFSGYAGCSDVLITDKKEWIKVTRQDFKQIPNHINIEMLNLSLQDLSEEVVAVTAFFHIHIPPTNKILSHETVRLVLIFRKEKDNWKIVHSGISIPYELAQENEIYPMSRLEKRNQELEKMINEHTKELAKANKLLTIQSNTDGLTNIGNRRHFDNRLSQEWSREQRSNTPLALIMIDIDHFKSFNDLYGHLIGDDCLKKIAQTINLSACRTGELAARYGGEEFVILLPNTTLKKASKIALHLQNSILSLAIPHTASYIGIVTISIGVASIQPSYHQSSIELIEQADIALYHAKSSGRNCIKQARKL